MADIILETVKDKNISKKLTSIEWNAIEQQSSQFIKKVIECLKNLGSETDKEVNKDQYKVIGEKLYLQIRPKLEKVKLVKSINTNSHLQKQKKEKISKKDEIKLNNLLKTLEKIIDEVLVSFGGDFTPFCAFNSKILEIKGIGLLYGCYYINEKHSIYNKPEHLPFVFNIMVASQRYINVCKDYSTQMFMDNTHVSLVSHTLISDLELWFNNLKSIYPYSGFAISDYAPQLFVHTEYDEAIPTVGIKPRNHQVELYKYINKNHENGYMLIYKAPIGGGKTSAIIILASYVMSLRLTYPEKYGKLQIIFACNLQAVRLQVSNMCYNGKIPFGVASMNVNSIGYKITNHNSCKDNSERIVIVASPDVTFSILDDKKNGDTSDKYILYLDEPTTGSDIAQSEILRSNMKVLVNMPKRTILVSATFPDVVHIQKIVDSFKYKYRESNIGTINSGEIYIGCNVKTFDNELVVPHLGVKTSDELKNIIEAITNWSVLKRIYTVNVIKDLYEKMIKFKCENIPNVPELFTNVDNMNCTNVGKIAINMLEILSLQSDDIIEKVCGSKIMNKKEINKEEVNKEEETFEWKTHELDELDKVDDPLDRLMFDKLGTTQSYRLTGGTLIRTDEDCHFCLNNFKNLIETIEETVVGTTINSQTKYKSATNILQIYKKDTDEFDKQLKREEDNPRRLQQYDLERFISEFKDSRRPRIKFPSFGQINSEEHLEKYAGKNKVNVINKRMSLNLESYNINNLNINDKTISLMMAGVGMYFPNSDMVNESYNNITLDLSSTGKLAYTVTDDSLCYGTDFPINNCIFIRKPDSKVSINTIFQFMGRAGRVGKSWVSNFYIDDGIAKMIINFARNSKQIQSEAINMVNAFNSEQSLYVESYRKKIDMIIQEEKNKEQEKEKEIHINKVIEINVSWDNDNIDNIDNIDISLIKLESESILTKLHEETIQENLNNITIITHEIDKKYLNLNKEQDKYRQERLKKFVHDHDDEKETNKETIKSWRVDKIIPNKIIPNEINKYKQKFDVDECKDKDTIKSWRVDRIIPNEQESIRKKNIPKENKRIQQSNVSNWRTR